MRSLGIIVAATLLVLADPGWAASQRDYDDCNQVTDLDRRIAGCSHIIDDREERAGNRATAYNNRGAAWAAKEEFDRAIADYDEAIRLAPKNAVVYFNRGSAWGRNNDRDRAIADLSEAIRLDPNALEAYNNRGLMFREKGEYARSIADFTRVMELRGKPTFEDYIARCISYRLSGNPSAALEDVKSAGAAYPEKRGMLYYYNLGWNLYLLDRYDEAIDALTSAIAYYPELYNAYFLRGASYDRKGDRTKALQDLQTAAANIPTQNWTDEAKAIFARYGMQRPGIPPTDVQSLAGTYDLYNLQQFRLTRDFPAPEGSMVIVAGDGDTIRLRSPSDIVRPDRVWEGVGKLQGKSGYYDWKFADGKKIGRTDFVVTADNDIIGHMQIADPAKQAWFNWWYLAKRRSPAAAVVRAPADLMAPHPLGDMALGAANAPVTIVEYASMTCPDCARFHEHTYPELKKHYIDTGKVRFIVREFPADALAAGGFMLARCVAAERGAAGYFAMIETLFREQGIWASDPMQVEPLLDIAKRAGFTEASFSACLLNQAVFDGLKKGRSQAAEKLGVNSTPTFFINGRVERGALSIEVLAEKIEPYLKGR